MNQNSVLKLNACAGQLCYWIPAATSSLFKSQQRTGTLEILLVVTLYGKFDVISSTNFNKNTSSLCQVAALPSAHVRPPNEP
jgi:hypothetical protein